MMRWKAEDMEMQEMQSHAANHHTVWEKTWPAYPVRPFETIMRQWGNPQWPNAPPNRSAIVWSVMQKRAKNIGHLEQKGRKMQDKWWN